MKVIYKHSANKAGVYIIYCTSSFGVYIGSTYLFKRRKSDHLRELRANKHHCQHLQNAWNKYGEDSFVFQVVEITPKEQRHIAEQKYLDIHFGKRYCYNSKPNASFSAANKMTKQELKNIYSRVKSDAEREKISSSHKNKTTITWKNRQYTDPRIIYGVDTLLEKGLFPRAMDFAPDEIEHLTNEALVAYKTFPRYVVHNPEKTSERTQLRRDFKLWLEYQGIWIDRRRDSWSRKNIKDQEVALENLQNGRVGQKSFKRY